MARALLALDWTSPIQVDVRGLRSAQLVSVFFSSFLDTISFDSRRDLLTKARAIVWETDFDFQLKNIVRWMALPAINRTCVYVAAPNKLAGLTRSIMDRIAQSDDVFEVVSASTHTDQTLSSRAIFECNVELMRRSNIFVAVLKDYGKDLTAEIGMAYMLRRYEPSIERFVLGIDYTADATDVMSYNAFDRVVQPDQLEGALRDWMAPRR